MKKAWRRVFLGKSAGDLWAFASKFSNNLRTLKGFLIRENFPIEKKKQTKKKTSVLQGKWDSLIFFNAFQAQRIWLWINVEIVEKIILMT